MVLRAPSRFAVQRRPKAERRIGISITHAEKTDEFTHGTNFVRCIETEQNVVRRSRGTRPQYSEAGWRARPGDVQRQELTRIADGFRDARFRNRPSKSSRHFQPRSWLWR